MEYHTEYINYNATIKRIYHISDIHINLQSKHDEYRYVFNNFYKFLIAQKKQYNIEISENKNIDCCIVITGDILHSKTELLPECIELTRDFLTKCSELMPTIMIAGNHDMNVNNKERLDGLTPIRNGIREELPLYYFKKSGIYHFGNIIWSVAAVQDYLIIPPDKIKETLTNPKNKTIICLFHGCVNGVILFNKSKLNGEFNKKTNKTITPESFKGYDYVLMGDIHKQQFMNKEKTIAYSGSLIQQNHGETLDKHGVLIWDIEKKTVGFKEIKNDYCFYTHTIKNSEITNDDIEQISKTLNKTHMRLRLYLDNTPYSKLQQIIALFKNNFNVLEVNYQDCSQGQETDIQKEITMNITNIEYQNKLIEEYLIRYTDTNEKNIEYIKRLNELSNKQLEKNDMWLNARWKLIKLEFSNLFSYGENNVINFSNHKGILGIIAPNHMGKSAIIDIILFTLYDKFPRKGNVKDIVNNRKNSFKSKLIFKIGEWKYIIFKSGNKTDKGRVSCKLDFYRINKENIKEILNEDTMVKTKNSILKYVGLYEDIIQTNISLQNNNCNFIEAENTARKKELERILQVEFINELQKKTNVMISDKRSVYKHLQNNCYEESIIELNKNIADSITNLNINDTKQKQLKLHRNQLENLIHTKTEQIIPNIEHDVESYKNKLGNLPSNKLKELQGKIMIITTENNTLIDDINKIYDKVDIKYKFTFGSLLKMEYNILDSFKKNIDANHIFFNNKKEMDLKQFNTEIEEYYKLIKNVGVRKSNNNNNNNINIQEYEHDIKALEHTIIKNESNLQHIKHYLIKIETNIKIITEKQTIISNFQQEELPQEMMTLLEETNIYELKEDCINLETIFKTTSTHTTVLKQIEQLEPLKKIYNKTSIYDYIEHYQTNLEHKLIYKESLIQEINKLKHKNTRFIAEINKLYNDCTDNHNNNHNTFIIELTKINMEYKTQLDTKQHFLSTYKSDLVIISNNKHINKKISLLSDKRNELFNSVNKEYVMFNKYYDVITKIHHNNTIIKELEAEHSSIENNIDTFQKIEDSYLKNKINKEDIMELKSKLDHINTEYNQLENNMNISKMEFTKNNTKLDEHKKEIVKMKDIEKELSIYTVYNDALKNLPFIIIKKVIPRLEKKINELLSVCTNFVVKVEVDNNHIDIYIDRPIYNGRLILLNNASGFERFISSLAIRMALLDISQLPKPNFIAIDEGWTSFDYQNINNVRTIFDFLIQKFDFVLSISHLSQIKEHCQHQIHLKKDKDDFSVIC